MNRIAMTFLTAILALTSAYAQQRDNEDHRLKSLWAGYGESLKSDKPKTSAARLEDIKEEALARRYAWDYYDACMRYSQVMSSINWKLRDSLSRQVDREVEAYGDPVMTYYHSMRSRDAAARLAFADSHKAELSSSRNYEFYKRDSFGSDMDKALLEVMQSDYEYILWSVCANDGNASSTLEHLYGGEYPQQAYIDFFRLGPVHGHRDAYQAYASVYAGKAAELLARQALIADDFAAAVRDGKDEDGDAVYRDLHERCVRFEADRKRYSRSEKTLCGCCLRVKDIDEALTAKDVHVETEDDKVLFLVRNVTSLSVRLKDQDGGKALSRTLSNPRKSFYLQDTLVLDISKLDDGEYSVSCDFGKSLNAMGTVSRYTLSASVQRDRDGWSCYVADKLTGRPVRKVDLSYYGKDGKVAASVRGMACSGSGYTRLPEVVVKHFDDKSSNCLQFSFAEGGRMRRSPKAYVREMGRHVETAADASEELHILTDRKAFHPDETVNFKVIAYKGAHVCQGMELVARLYDSEMNELDSLALKTNEFGSAAGSFVLRRSARNGEYEIEVESDEDVASTYVLVDDFQLPSFDLSFDDPGTAVFKGDVAEIGGTVMSYSGHSLSSATITYAVSHWRGKVDEGTLSPDASGRFSFKVDTGDRTGWFNVAVKVTDATGETREFTTGIDVNDAINLWLQLENQISGVCSPDVKMLDGDVAKVRVRAADYPGLAISYHVICAGDTVRTGTAKAGGTVSIDLAGLPSAIYRIEARASAVSQSGTKMESSETLSLLKASSSDSTLPGTVAFYATRLLTDNSAGMRIGSGKGPAWAVLQLFGKDDELLDSRLCMVGDESSGTGSLAGESFIYKDGYPDRMLLKMICFLDGNVHRHSVKIDRVPAGRVLPLAFERFTDTSAPGASCTVTLVSAPGTEAAAAVFDKSADAFMQNAWWAPYIAKESFPSPYQTDVCGGGGGVINSIAMSKGSVIYGAYARNAMLDEAVPVAAAYKLEEYEAIEAPTTNDAFYLIDGEALGGSAMNPRSDFRESLCWEPFLRTDGEGRVSFTFKASDKLSTYHVNVFAHDRDMRCAVLVGEMKVTVPVKVAVVEARTLYEGDRYILKSTLSNGSGAETAGRIVVCVYDGADWRTASVIGGGTTLVSVAPMGEASADTEIVVPEGVDTLGIKVAFVPDDGEAASDAVFVTVPVHKAVQTVVESHSALLRDGDDRDEAIKALRREFANADGSSAEVRDISIRQMLAEAMPEKTLAARSDVLSLSDALLANAIASGLGVQTASGQQTDDMYSRLLACRCDDGGFGWYAGMQSSPVVTAVVLERFGRMGEALRKDVSALLPDAVKYLDNAFFGDTGRPAWCGCIGSEQYMHVRAMYRSVPFSSKGIGSKALSEFRKQASEYLVPKDERGFNGCILAKARRVQTLRNLVRDADGLALAKSWGISVAGARLSASLGADIASLKEYVVDHKSGGCYYPNAVMPWRGLLESELYAHTLLCDLFDETAAAGDAEAQGIAEGIRLWLMVQKETQKWSSDAAYVDALCSVFHGQESTLDTKVVSLTASSTKAFSEVKASGNGFRISRTYKRDGKVLHDGAPLKTGDKVVAEYAIWNEENRSFVRVTAPRPACMTPVHQVSGPYGWWLSPLRVRGWVRFSPQGYRNVLVSSTEYDFDAYPEENTVIAEEFFVTAAGEFHAPAVTVESLYAPHYRANDKGTGPVKVL